MTIPRGILGAVLLCLLSVAMVPALLGQPIPLPPVQDEKKPVEFKGEAKVSVHAFKMQKGDAYRITVKGEGFAPQVRIEGQGGGYAANPTGRPTLNPITTLVDPNTAPATRREAQLIFMPSATRVYQITVDFASDADIGKGPHAYTLTLERAVFKTQAAFQEPQLALGDDSRRLEKGKVYGITVTGQGVAPEVQILDGTRSLATAVNGRWYGFGPDAEFICTLTFMPLRTTDYRILLALGPVTEKRQTPLKYTTHVVELKVELSVTEQLTHQDPAYPRRGGRHKVHAVKLETGKTYQIDMISRAFDTYLFLEDAGGTVLMQDDDSGGNLNARIVFRPTRTDTYRIVATTFEQVVPGKSPGPYTLTVVENPQAQPAFPGAAPAGKGLPKSKN